MSDESLIGYCGLYCGACAIHQQTIRERAEQLLDVLNAYQFREIAEEAKGQFPALSSYPEFEDVLKVLMETFGECPGCPAGGGPPACEIRDCCKQGSLSTCAECDKMPCEKLEPQVQAYEGHLDELRRIRKIGKDAWAREMEDRIQEGFSYSDVLK